MLTHTYTITVTVTTCMHHCACRSCDGKLDLNSNSIDVSSGHATLHRTLYTGTPALHIFVAGTRLEFLLCDL